MSQPPAVPELGFIVHHSSGIRTLYFLSTDPSGLDKSHASIYYDTDKPMNLQSNLSFWSAPLIVTPIVRRCMGLIVWVAVGLLPAQAPAVTIHSVSQSAAEVGRYRPLTVQFSISRSYANPYDPDQIDARFEFTG